MTVIKELNVHSKGHQVRAPHFRSHLQAKETNNFVAAMGRYFNNLAAEQGSQNKLTDKHSVKENGGYTLGISIVQGSDGNVYVKDIVAGGPGDKSGIRIGDQVRESLVPFFLLQPMTTW